MKISTALFFILVFFCSCATSGTEDNVQKASAHYKIGISYFNENKIQSAFVEFQKALEFNSRDKDVLYALGLVYLKFEDFQKAEGSFKKAITIDPDFSEAHNSLGFTYKKMKEWAEAVDSFKRALKNPLYQRPEKAYHNLGDSYYRLDLIDDAINAYKEAIKRMQDFHLPYYGLALSYNAKSRYGDASTAIARAIELDPLYNGDREKAVKDLKERKIRAKGDEEKDIIDCLEILKY